MATVQVRELPEETYEVLRRRARLAGQSIQAYLRDQLIALAARPSKAEAIEAIEAILSRLECENPTAALILADIAAERR